LSCPRENEVLEQFAAGEVSSHAAECDRCQALVAELESMSARLAPDEGEFEDPELARDVATLIKLKKTPERKQRHWPYAIAPIAIAAALALVFVRPNDGFQERSGVEQADRWVSIEAFRARDGVTGYQKVEHDIKSEDALVFSLENRPESPYRHAMIFAFDDRGQIFWYYPAYTDAAQNPVSIPAPASSKPIALEEAVRHRLEPGWLRVVGLFSRAPLDVKSVEEIVSHEIAEKGGVRLLERIPIEETGQHSFLLRVSR
jgi:hypothetical protein